MPMQDRAPFPNGAKYLERRFRSAVSIQRSGRKVCGSAKIFAQKWVSFAVVETYVFIRQWLSAPYSGLDQGLTPFGMTRFAYIISCLGSYLGRRPATVSKLSKRC